MAKVVINACFGGFSISRAAAEHMATAGSDKAKIELKEAASEDRWYGYGPGADGYSRDDPFLVAAVEALGEKASGDLAALKVVEIPDGVEWEIEEYDGNEHIAEKHRCWS